MRTNNKLNLHGTRSGIEIYSIICKLFDCYSTSPSYLISQQKFDVCVLLNGKIMCCSWKYPYPFHINLFPLNQWPLESFILSFKNYGLQTPPPLPLEIAVNLPLGGYGYFLELHNADYTYYMKLQVIEFLPELKSSLDIWRAYASHSFLLKLKIITGWKFLSMIIFTILKQFEGPKTNKR